MVDALRPTEADEAAPEAWEAFWREADRAEGLDRLKEQHPDFLSRAGEAAELIASVTPRLATPNAMTQAEYQELLKEPMWRLLPFLREPVRTSLAQKLVAAQR